MFRKMRSREKEVGGYWVGLAPNCRDKLERKDREKDCMCQTDQATRKENCDNKFGTKGVISKPKAHHLPRQYWSSGRTTRPI